MCASFHTKSTARPPVALAVLLVIITKTCILIHVVLAGIT